MTPFVNDYTGILGFSSWASDAPTAPTVLTYSFSQEGQSFWPFPSGVEDVESFQTFTDEQEETARAALDLWASLSGLLFIEVPAGQGDLSFGNYDLPADLAGSTIHPARL